MTCENDVKFTSASIITVPQAHSLLVYASSMAAFMLPQQSSVVATEAIWPAQLKIFTIWSLIQKNLQALALDKLSYVCARRMCKSVHWSFVFTTKKLEAM